jgi:SAM-dependent methyltransferase
MIGAQIDPIVQRNQLAYNRIAAEWEKRLATDYDAAFHDQCRAIFLDHLPGRRVLDIGCGLGIDSAAFAAAGLDVLAADIAADFLPIVRARNPGVSVLAADMTMPCFRAGSFDGIFAVASFLHVPHHLAQRTLAGFARILAPEGVLFLHHAAASDGREGYQVDDLLMRDNPVACFCHEEAELSSMLALEGLGVTSLTHVRPSRHPSASAARDGLEPYQVIAKKREVSK